MEKPLEVNKANRRDLLHIPGIGPKGADAILLARRHSTLRNLSSLHKLGIFAERAAPFILLNGRQMSYQMNLL